MHDYEPHSYASVNQIQWTGTNPYAVRAFVGMHTTRSGGTHHIFTIQEGIYNAELYVAASETWEPIHIGDWVVKDRQGFRIKRRSKTKRGLRVLRRRTFV